MLDKASERLQQGFRKGQPNIFAPFDRMGIDPFRDRFEITLRHEGTVRGTGGIVIDDRTATGINGLFAAGDAATRQAMAGATSGGGGPNAAWALATGSWAGEGAAAFARRLGAHHAARRVRSARPRPPVIEGPGREADIRAVIDRIRGETLPLEKGFFRNGESLAGNRAVLESLWRDETWRRAGTGHDAARIREAEALIATARWVTESALLRRETRGVHRRTDFAEADPALAVRIESGGLDDPWATYEPDLQKESIAS